MKVKDFKNLLWNLNDEDELTLIWNNGPEDYGRYIKGVEEIKVVNAIGYSKDFWSITYPDDLDEGEHFPPLCSSKLLVIT